MYKNIDYTTTQGSVRYYKTRNIRNIHEMESMVAKYNETQAYGGPVKTWMEIGIVHRMYETVDEPIRSLETKP